jgi:hypothetical protein
MLKIKDNVDLKELEKFGFINADEKYYPTKKNDLIDRKSKNIYICKDREITQMIYDEYDEIDLDIIYDLIKADLVEKVEE